MPSRIQRARTKGYRLPPGAIYVGRPTIWGNPFPVDIYGAEGAAERFRRLMAGRMSADESEHSSHWGDLTPFTVRRSIMRRIAELLGHDLVCWCGLCDMHRAFGKPLGSHCPCCEPCHADVLIEIANG